MKLADLFDCFLIDLDGVIYVGDSPTPSSVETTKHLLKNNKAITFLTNNPGKTYSQYLQKLNKMGIEEKNLRIITSCTALAQYVKSKFGNLQDKRAFVAGSDALKEEIKLAGLNLISGEEAKKANIVIFGGHPDFNYEEMKIATLALSNGAHFFATNRDHAYPTQEGYVPATGAMLASIETASGKKAICAGKPEAIMFKIALGNFDNKKEKIAIIGDHIPTDIEGGKKAGITTILVLSGLTKEKELRNSAIKPDYVIERLGDLLDENYLKYVQ